MASTLSEELRLAALAFHRLPRPGKLEIQATKPLANQRDLALAYSPGVAAACVGAVMPDVLDQRMAGLAPTRRGRQKIFNAVHRGTTHWFGWWLILCAVAFAAPGAQMGPMGRDVLLGLGFGGLSHVALDMLTPSGVPLTPFSRSNKFSLKLCSTGSLGEYCFLLCVVGLAWWFYGADLLKLTRHLAHTKIL